MTNLLCYYPRDLYTKGDVMTAIDGWRAMSDSKGAASSQWVPTVGGYPERMPNGKKWAAIEIQAFGPGAEIYKMKMNISERPEQSVEFNMFTDAAMGRASARQEVFGKLSEELLGFDDAAGRNFMLTHFVTYLKKYGIKKIEVADDNGKIRVDGNISDNSPRPAPHS